MPHPSCEGKRASHLLDHRVPEWKLFEAIQPIFAAELPWRLRPQDEAYEAPIDDDAQAILSANTLDFFKHEMRKLPDTAPTKELSCKVFDNCLGTLSDLLHFLDSLVQSNILDVRPRHGTSEIERGEVVEDKEDEYGAERSVSILTTVADSARNVWSWLGISFSEPQSGGDVSSVAGSLDLAWDIASNIQEDMSNKIIHRYPKLAALRKVFEKLSQCEVDAVKACASYLILKQTTHVYTKGKGVLYSFNTCMESSAVSGSKRLNFSYPLEIPRSRWKDFGPLKFSIRLLNVLQENICECSSGHDQYHQAMLRLNGFQLETSPLVFDMFFLSCQNPKYWQESRFMSITAQTSSQRPEFVHNLCEHVSTYQNRWGESTPTVLDISFNEKQLFAATADLLAHHGVSPAMSLEELLSLGFFRKPTAGGAFSPGDKAVLALSLARCLLHLLQSPWMERPLTAESVRFLHKSAAAEVLDIHHPYICYYLPQNKDTDAPVSLVAKYWRILLSFARLLLEIEIGAIIPLDPSLSDDPEGMVDALDDILCRQDEQREPYIQAIEGCLKFKALLASRQRHKSKRDSSDQIREVLYTSVIERLEQNLSRFRNYRRLLVRRNLRIQDRSIKSAEIVTVPAVPPQLSSPGPHIRSQISQASYTDLHATTKISLVSKTAVEELPISRPHSPRQRDHLCRPSTRQEFEIAIICALRLEYDAVALLFDEFWDEDGDPYGKAPGDKNTYTTGRIGNFNVVLVLLPGMGKANAASAAASFCVSYTKVKLALLVGICGGVPRDSKGRHIHLGDVVISDYIVQYDFGRLLPDKFKIKDTLQDRFGRPNADLRGFISTLQTQHHLKRLRSRTARYLKDLQTNNGSDPGRFVYPGPDEDRLFEASYRHKHSVAQNCRICNLCTQPSDPVCDEALTSLCSELRCDENRLVTHRERLIEKDEAYKPVIHFGSIASGDTVMKSGEDRNLVAKKENVIAFEMEGAGVWDNIPCLVIKGVCDYADSHKDKRWQDFAAATAASAMKALLERYHKTDKCPY